MPNGCDARGSVSVRLIASVAAIIYVAHLGQARSDAGTGYELDAITAVVLGGTSVFGGRGTIGVVVFMFTAGERHDVFRMQVAIELVPVWQ